VLSAGEVSELYSGIATSIYVTATLNGQPWPASGSNAVTYTLSGPSGDISNSSVPFTYEDVVADETYALNYLSGGPAGATYDSVTPPIPQLLPNGASIAFDINFVSGQQQGLCGNGVIDAGEDCDAGPTNPVAWWKLDDSGTTASDSSGNGNTGVLTYDPAWTTGKIGGALHFDGEDDYVDFGTGSNLDISGDEITISMWAKADVIGAQKHTASRFPCYYIDLLANGTYSFRLGFADLDGTTAVSAGTWHHVVGVKTSTQMILYLDGNQDAIRDVSGNLDNTCTHSMLGRFLEGGYQFEGSFDDVRIYDRALSAAEIGNPSSQCLGGATCSSRGFTGGSLSYDASTCKFDESQCTLPPDFNLYSLNSDSLFLTISGSGAVTSNTVQITVVPLPPCECFDKDVTLSLENINPAIAGAVGNFSDTILSEEEYSTGSSFSITVPPNTPSGLYTVTIHGETSNLSPRLLVITLNISIRDSGFKEVMRPIYEKLAKTKSYIISNVFTSF